jgi:ABC-type lipoprotein release transport system permease subunit
MLELKLAIRNLARRPRRSFTLLLIIAAAVFLLFSGNAVFDGTSAGIAESFLRSFTGDLVVRARDVDSYSLFGDETPIIGELLNLPELAPYRELTAYLDGLPELRKTAPQLSGVAYLELPGYRMPAYLFGIESGSYFSALDGVCVARGRAIMAGERGIMVGEARLAEMERAIGRKLELGESIQLTIATETSFRIRGLPLVGITRYPVANATLDRIVLVDAGTLRSLYGMGVSGRPAVSAPPAAVSLLGGGLDDIFADAAADSGATGEGLDRSGIEASLSEPESAVPADSGTGPWHYLILRLAPGADAERVRVHLNRDFAIRGWPVEAIGWRDAAGSGALYVYWLRVIFNVGVVVVAFAGLIIVVNALVSGVFERTGEIGTMRALGAQRAFVARLFALETGILALVAGALGTVCGVIAAEFLSRRGIAIANPFLVQLFGGPRLKLAYGAAAVLRALLASVVMGSLAWIHPVRLALKVEPVEAMRRQE